MANRSQRGEIQQMQQEIAREIRTDAPPIANGVFGNNALHPDMATVSNQELDQIYLAAYARNDRQWLMQEAQRDPRQFLDVTDRINVPDPPLDRQGNPMPSQAQQDQLAGQLQAQAMQNAAQSAPAALPQSVPPPMAPTPQALPPPPPAPGQLPLPGVG